MAVEESKNCAFWECVLEISDDPGYEETKVVLVTEAYPLEIAFQSNSSGNVSVLIKGIQHSVGWFTTTNRASRGGY